MKRLEAWYRAYEDEVNALEQSVLQVVQALSNQQVSTDGLRDALYFAALEDFGRNATLLKFVSE